jgi:DNA-binding response OmpR family regulator
MCSPVIVLSPDNIRGAILEKILSRSGFDVLWSKSYYEAEDVLDKNAPMVLIFDAKGLRAKETGLLEKLRINLPGAVIIALVEADAMPISEPGVSPRQLWLPEPFDPELIVSKVKEIVSSPPVQRASDTKSGKDMLAASLKQFLKLD